MAPITGSIAQTPVTFAAEVNNFGSMQFIEKKESGARCRASSQFAIRSHRGGDAKALRAQG